MLEINFKKLENFSINSYWDTIEVLEYLYLINEKKYYELEKKHNIVFDSIKNNNDLLLNLFSDKEARQILMKAYNKAFSLFVKDELESYEVFDTWEKNEYLMNFDLFINPDKIEKINPIALKGLIYKKMFKKLNLGSLEHYLY